MWFAGHFDFLVIDEAHDVHVTPSIMGLPATTKRLLLSGTPAGTVVRGVRMGGQTPACDYLHCRSFHKAVLIYCDEWSPP